MQSDLQGRLSLSLFQLPKAGFAENRLVGINPATRVKAGVSPFPYGRNAGSFSTPVYAIVPTKLL